MPELAKKKRIFQIAKELNISHVEIIQFLKNNGTEVDSHMAPVSPESYDEILLEFSKDKLQIERHRKEQARKVVVSKIHMKEAEEPKLEKKVSKPPVRKLKTSINNSWFFCLVNLPIFKKYFLFNKFFSILEANFF